MKACGLIVEYNPLHNGHIYHINRAREVSGAECIIAIMSGSFLQRGEPAIIDKFHRTRAALQNGVDIVVELPFPFAVQSSEGFAKGAVQTLNEIGVSSICFGSESGHIKQFINSFQLLNDHKTTYETVLKQSLGNGFSFPAASEKAYRAIGFNENHVDLTKPNNILGFSYVREILANELPIQPLTIGRTKNDYHDTTISNQIASATSIRKYLLSEQPSEKSGVERAIPSETLHELQAYKSTTNTWHEWEQYFPLLNYIVSVTSVDELAQINGMVEGIEHRIKKTARIATSMNQWIELIKTKRYTWTRIQRIFVYLLTRTTKDELNTFLNKASVPYIRVLGLSKTGRSYVNVKKEALNVPIIHNMSRSQPKILSLEERATNAYYSIISPASRDKMLQQERRLPILIDD